jgi:hypothetical protein
MVVKNFDELTWRQNAVEYPGNNCRDLSFAHRFGKSTAVRGSSKECLFDTPE